MVRVNGAKKALSIVKWQVQSPIAFSDACILSTDRLLWVTGCCWLPLHFAWYPASLNGLGWLERHWNVGWCGGQRCRSHLCCVRTEKLAISLVVMSPSFLVLMNVWLSRCRLLRAASPDLSLNLLLASRLKWDAISLAGLCFSAWQTGLHELFHLLFFFLIRFPLLFCRYVYLVVYRTQCRGEMRNNGSIDLVRTTQI